MFLSWALAEAELHFLLPLLVWLLLVLVIFGKLKKRSGHERSSGQESPRGEQGLFFFLEVFFGILRCFLTQKENITGVFQWRMENRPHSFVVRNNEMDANATTTMAKAVEQTHETSQNQ